MEQFTLSIQKCTITQGEIYAVIGPNGSGKTSFLNLLALLNRPLKGDIVFNGENLDFSDNTKLLSIRREIAYLTQNPYLFNMTVTENVGYGLKIRGLNKSDIARRVENIMRRLDIFHLSARNAHSLSGGEAQRVALARVLVLDTKVLLLDEATANIDRPSMHSLEKIVLDICREKKITVILTTHSNEQAYRMSSTIFSIINGNCNAVKISDQ
jgi:tungstate transport system ATP-binding protein